MHETPINIYFKIALSITQYDLKGKITIETKVNLRTFNLTLNFATSSLYIYIYILIATFWTSSCNLELTYCTIILYYQIVSRSEANVA